jgi:FkbM family methyltransferase
MDQLLTLGSKYLKHPVYLRTKSTDRWVFREIFIWREYECLDWLKTASLIIDCGANVGYSSAYFLSRFPGATVIALEPDSANFKLLQKNVAPYGNRCRTINAAVWPERASLAIDPTPYRGGGENARVVRLSADNEDQVSAITIPEVLGDSGFVRISLLKVDIERSELELFRADSCAWLQQVDTVIIELHDEECEAVFYQAAKTYNFECSRHGALTVARNRNTFDYRTSAH